MLSPKQLDEILGEGSSNRISDLGATEAFDTFEHFLPQTTLNAKLAGVAVLLYIKGYAQRVKEEQLEKSNNVLVSHAK
jgi:hypothetical protein